MEFLFPFRRIRKLWGMVEEHGPSGPGWGETRNWESRWGKSPKDLTAKGGWTGSPFPGGVRRPGF